MPPDPYDAPTVDDPHVGYDQALHFRRFGLSLLFLMPLDVLAWLMVPRVVSRACLLLLFADLMLGLSLRRGEDWRDIALARLLVGVGLSLALFLPSRHYESAALFCLAHLGAGLLGLGVPSTLRQLAGLLLAVAAPALFIAGMIWGLASG